MNYAWQFIFSQSLSHMADEASEGIDQPPRGDRLKPHTHGPSGMQERLNCWLKKRRQNVVSQCLIVVPSYTPAKTSIARL
jgi:hypothetical protein